MQKFLGVLFLALITITQARPSVDDYEEPDEIIQQVDDRNVADNTYNFEFETSNGIRQAEHSELMPGDNRAPKVEGHYKYFSPEGDEIEIKYVADENGFHAVGSAIPTPPPIPPEILKGVQLALAAEERRKAKSQSIR